jgi:hypothetical protein
MGSCPMLLVGLQIYGTAPVIPGIYPYVKNYHLKVYKSFVLQLLQIIFKDQLRHMSNALKLFLFFLLLSWSGFSQSVNFSSSNLPIVIINTNGQTIPDEPKIMADMGMINNPNGARNNVTDSMNEYNGKIGIEVRGESSQMFPMKSYSIELRKATGSSQDLPMLGMPKESDWVLYAPYTDKTLMRNFLAYTMSRELGHWSANCRFVEVVLNGPQYQDPVNGVRKFADISSFIDYFIVNEVSRNVDGYRLSSYFYKDRNSINRKIIAGPVWDYDLAFRNANYCNGSDINGWAYQFNYVCPGDGAGLIPFWWNRFMTDTAFVGELRCRWKAKRQTSLSLTRINQLIDSVNTLVGEAQQRHFTRWPVLGQYVWPNPNPIPTTYAGEISQLKSWISARMDWIDNNLPNAGACSDWPTDKPGTMVVSAYPNPFIGTGQIIIASKEN